MNAPLCEICKAPKIQLFTTWACKTDHTQESKESRSYSGQERVLLKYPAKGAPKGWTFVSWRSVQTNYNNGWCSYDDIVRLARNITFSSCGNAKNLLDGIPTNKYSIEYAFSIEEP